jgi:hypothetical protein
LDPFFGCLSVALDMRDKRQKSLSVRRAEFIADLAAQGSEIMPQKRRKLKSVSLEKMADLYLINLSSEKNEGVFLNELLDRHGIYYTIDSIQQCLDLLLERRFIVLAPFGFSTFRISQARSIWTRRFAESWKIPLYDITDAGLHFVLGGRS